MRERHGRRVAAVVVAGLALAAAAGLPSAATAAGPGEPAHVDDDRFDAAVDRVLDLPYAPTYAPTGTDTAFGEADWPAAFPLTDTTTGTCCTSPVPDQPPAADLAPPFAAFPDGFDLVELTSYDGTPLHAFASIEPGAPGVVVMHGFNTNGKHSVVRYAAFLRANGFSVIAPDHRDMGREWERGGSWSPDGTRRGQTLGWKEAEDLLVAAEVLRAHGAPTVGVLGFSEGAQNTLLALGRDFDGAIDTALTFSGPSDQRTQVNREPAATAALLTTVVNNPDVCGYLDEVGQREEFSASPNFMLRQASAVDTLDGVLGAGVDAPALHLYAADDALVPDYHATILASRTRQLAHQRTVLVEAGNHAYFYDRWWTQRAALEWFRTWLDPGGRATTAEPTVAEPPAGQPLHEQVVDLSDTTREQAEAERASEPVCEPAAEPIGPTALLTVEGAGPDRVLDGRRSWSGWDEHEVVAFELDPGDGTAPHTGDDLVDAVLDHTYRGPGTYEATLTVTDDTGRTATTSRTIEVTGGQGDGGADAGRGARAGDGTEAGQDGGGAPGEAAGLTRPLPATGGGLAGGAVMVAMMGLAAGRRRG